MKKKRLAASEWYAEEQRLKRQSEDIEYSIGKLYDIEKRLRGLNVTIEYAGQKEIALKVEAARILLKESFDNLQALK